MELSTPRFKALAVSAGLSFWFFVITNAVGVFSLEVFGIFVIIVFGLMQVLSIRVAKALDYVAIFNTKLFLGILFVFVITFYGIFFRILRIDLLRLKKEQKSYWLDVERLNDSRIFKQY
jgi:hypothetical protein